jgi:hypothetical protein
MTVTLNLNPETEKGLLAQAHERGVSLDDYLEDLVSKQVRLASPVVTPATLKLPIRHLGTVGSLHRRDIYDDAH